MIKKKFIDIFNNYSIATTIIAAKFFDGISPHSSCTPSRSGT